MASSQVEIASSSPFGYVLNNRCCSSSRDSNSFKKNFKNLVQSHLHSCITNQSKKTFPSDSCENSQNNADLWVHKTEFSKNCSSPKKRSKAAEKWDKARTLVFSMEKENQESCCLDVPNLGGGGGVSSLVRKWKNLETESKFLNLVSNSDECCYIESCSIVKSSESSIGDWEESDKTDDVISTKDSDVVKESERLGVADIIKKLKFDNGNVVVANGGSLPRVRTTSTMDHSEQQRCSFSPVLSSPRFIRGRQAFSDLLLQMEHDRQREIEGLVEHKAVSKFQQRGRIQALLRVRLIRRGAEGGDRSVKCAASESNKSTHSAIMHLREKFNTVEQHGLAVSRNTSKVAAESIHESGSLPSTPNRQQKENSFRDFKGLKSPQRELARSNSAKVGTGFSLYQQREEDPLKGLVKERAGLQPVVADSISTSITLGDNTRDPSISKKENHHKPRSPHKEVVDNKPKVGNIVISNLLQEENHHEEVPEKVSTRKVETSIQVRNILSSHQQREGDRHKELVRETTGMQPGVADSRSTLTASGENARELCTSKEESHHKPRHPHKEVVDNIPKVGIFCISNQLREENHYEELCKKLSSRKVATSILVTNLSENQKEMTCSTKKSEGSCRLNQHHMDPNRQEVTTSLPSCTSQAQSLDEIPEKASWGNTSSEASHCNLLDFVESERPPKDRGANKQLPGTCNEWSSDCTNPQSDREEEAANQYLIESDSGSVSEYSLTASGWDELQSNYQQDNEDWISDISRPRKEWEGLRQERYQEMLDPFSDKHDIQQLLHRKSVSSFLTSDLREEIDRIMASRSQQLPNATSIHVEEEVLAQVAEDEEEEVEQNTGEEEDEVGEEEEEEWGFDDDSEDDNIPSRQRYNEPEVLILQNTSSQTSQSWNTNRDQEVTDDSYHFPSPSSLQSQISSNISSTRHPSTEMELIYEMRGHMEQLHQEIFEIRRSMKSCMNMQMKLQRSIKKDVAAAISQLGELEQQISGCQKSRGNSDNKGSNKGNCRICCEKPVDSLLYRCGHMCTCFLCAHELISGTGKCPICQAPIMDVVRAYTHS